MSKVDEIFDGIASADAQFRFLEAPEMSLPIDRAQAVMPGPLSGQVIGVKSNIKVAGQGWTTGIAARASEVPRRDAVVVAQLRAAGALMLSRLKMDEAALGAATENPHFGGVENPAAPGFSVGGSSGGSAAAVACGAVRVALGTDTLGSVRIPAAYCGCLGLKPGPQQLASEGTFPLAPDYDAMGVIARDFASLRAVYEVLSPPAVTEGSAHLAVPAPLGTILCAPEVAAGFARAVAAARALGLLRETHVLEDWDPVATRKAAFAEIAHEAHLQFSGMAGLSPALTASLAYGASRSDEARAAGAVRLDSLRMALAAQFAQGTILLTPTTPSPAFVQGTRPPADQATFTALANIVGGASLAIPVPGEGVPVSVQLTGGQGTEWALIEMGEALSTALRAGA